jgi:hypothetical protein
MPRELVTIQCGQCGNQIGCRFWELALREHAAYNSNGVFDEALSRWREQILVYIPSFDSKRTDDVFVIHASLIKASSAMWIHAMFLRGKHAP